MSSKLPKVSVIGGGSAADKTGFEKLPDTDPAGTAVIIAARKSRADKNRVAIKIGAFILSVSAIVAGLTAFLLTRGSPDTPLYNFADRHARTMRIDIDDTEAVENVAAATEIFARDLYQEMSGDVGEDNNILLSPYSAAMVLSMAAVGAQGNTKKQLLSGLHIKDLDRASAGWSQSIPALRSNENFTLETANAGFVMKDYKLLDSYRETLHTSYHTDISPVNFAQSQVAADMINSWVQDMTNKKIDQLISEDMVDGLTRLVLVNAVHFKGDWQTKFNPRQTQVEPFYVSKYRNVEVDMMGVTDEFPHAQLDSLDSVMIEMPYQGDRIVMQILLPNQRAEGLASINDKLADVDLNQLFQENQRKIKVKVRMPKFKISTSASLSDYLKNMGIKDMFSQGTADFSGIDGTRNLYVSFIKQKVFIEVNEEGSEAAAATGMGMMMRSMPLPPEEVTIDHPFLFYIRDKLTGMILFQGRISDPTSSE